MAKVDDWLALVIPRRCGLCHAPSGAGGVCAGCRDDLPWLGPGCPTCGAWLAPAAPAGLCARCAAGRPARMRIRAAFAYEYPIDRMITRAKFHRQLHFARVLGELLAESVRFTPGEASPVDFLVPVPLHPRRLAARGYNQALEIARPLAAALRLPLDTRLCLRWRHTPEQTGLPASERRRNLRGAFALRGHCAGARIAIVDDVITTGSTAAALAQALRQGGAAHVQAWAVARTL